MNLAELKIAGKKSFDAGKELAAAIHEYDAPAMCDDDFWTCFQGFMDTAKFRAGHGDSQIKTPVRYGASAAIFGIMTGDGWSMEAWDMAAGFVAAFHKLVDRIAVACDDMPCGKSDDSFGDFCDALPLAGREIVDGVLNGEIVHYAAIEAALEGNRLKPIILDGENYIGTALVDQLERAARIAGGRE